MQVFEKHGTVEEVFVMRGGSRSGMACAFVRFETQAMAQAAIDGVHGRITLPKAAEPLVVRWADAPGSRKRDGREGRGGKGRGGGGMNAGLGMGGGMRGGMGGGMGGAMGGGLGGAMDPNWGRMPPMMNGGMYAGQAYGMLGSVPQYPQFGGFAGQQGMVMQPGVLGGAQYGSAPFYGGGMGGRGGG